MVDGPGAIEQLTFPVERNHISDTCSLDDGRPVKRRASPVVAHINIRLSGIDCIDFVTPDDWRFRAIFVDQVVTEIGLAYAENVVSLKSLNLSPDPLLGGLERGSEFCVYEQVSSHQRRPGLRWPEFPAILATP